MNELAYKTTDCTGDATTTTPTDKMGDKVGECKKDPMTGVKSGKMKSCSSTAYSIDLYSTEDCTGTATNTVLKIDGTCVKNADGKTSYKVVWVPKAEGAKAAVAAAWALVATAMVMTQV